ncbi:hypothetical protein HME9302_00612 [Alteripontixanthobacter maritimus]|uniref:Uncharacterized protein n=1 Tax=Alteripontixanthobacter maritimus TaxID=2161824 RepID=A0A369Q3V3_9SPHN|nr:hypothetical protein [Alteripontixanthobacter maritimus]RDC59424.1 hypothetical protein HME9302_00612 [Alteripontixanthobacter maritimus]
MSSGHDLSGSWEGVFTYPGGDMPTTPFVLKARHQGNAFTGEIIEPSIYGGRTISAIASGVCTDRQLDFVKTYRTTGMTYGTPVDYKAIVSADGLEVTGVWSLPEWAGTFEMHRDALPAPRAETEAEASVPIAAKVSLTEDN